MICTTIFLSQSYIVDFKNPVGYPIGIMTQWLLALYILLYMASFLSIALGTYFIVNSINGFLKNDIESINKAAKSKKHNPHVLESFFRFICAHAEIKQLSY